MGSKRLYCSRYCGFTSKVKEIGWPSGNVETGKTLSRASVWWVCSGLLEKRCGGPYIDELNEGKGFKMKHRVKHQKVYDLTTKF